MNSRRRVRITESDLHRIVRESVDRVLYEGPFDTLKTMWKGGQAARDLKNMGNKPDNYYGGEGAKEYNIANKIYSQLMNQYGSQPAVIQELIKLLQQ